MNKVQRTVCDPNCHANPRCGISTTVEDGNITAVAPAGFPVAGYENRICLMGQSRLEQQYHPDRLRTPLKRIGERGEGRWEAISWEEAVNLFTKKHKETAEKYGPRSVACTQFTGAFGLLTRGVVTRYAALTGATVQGVGGVDYGLPKGLEYMLGMPASGFFIAGGHDMRDAANSNVTLIWGSNMAVTRSVDHAPLKAARQSGTRLICIDPTFSETAGFCDEWISLRPGSDGALALALANWILKRDLIDEEFLVKHSDMPFLVNLEVGSLLREHDVSTGGSDKYMVWCSHAKGPVTVENAVSAVLDKRETVETTHMGQLSLATVYSLFKAEAAGYPPDVAETITGVPASTVTRLAEDYAKARPGAIRMGFGIDRYYYSDSTARAIAALVCLTGNIGVPGGGISINSGARTAPVRSRTFYSPGGKMPTTLSMMEIDSAVRQGTPYPIKMECIALANPFNQLKPNRARVLQDYIGNLDFIAVIDHFMTDTAKQADLVLPACTIFERTDIVVDSCLQLQQRIVEPEGEAKSDFEIFCLFGAAMGYGDYFDKTAEEYLDIILSATAEAEPMMKDVSFSRLQDEEVIYPWDTSEPYIGFRDRVFSTPSGRIQIYIEELRKYDSALPTYREPVEASPKNPLFARYPLVLLSCHSRYRIHSSFANLEMTRAKEPEPLLRICPADAQARGLAAGDIVKVFNDRGSLKIKCEIDDRMRSGTVLVREGHWIDQFIEGDPYILTHDKFNESAENYAQYDVLVEVEQA